MIEFTFRSRSSEEEEEVELPSKNEVCWRCHGEGVHDCWEGGMTSDEMHEQGPDFIEDYFNGVYNTRCTVCDGMRVLKVVDAERLRPDQKKRYEETLEIEYEYQAELEFEARMRRWGREW
jgi:hypothetical protein